MNQEHKETGKISVEFLVYACILIIGMVFRFLMLGQIPLNDSQAHLALEALNVAHGNEIVVSGQPGYISLTAMLFFLFQESEFFAQFWPALIGSLLVLVPLLFRDLIGKNTAIILALLLAFDPFLIDGSRSSVGSIFALAGLLAGVGFWQKGRPVLSGIGFGLALLGGVDLWPGLIAVGLTFLVTFWSQRSAPAAEKTVKHKISITTTVICGIVTAVVISTLFFTNPGNVSAIGSSLVEYVQSWSRSGTMPFYSGAILWLILELPALCFGIWGLVTELKIKSILGNFLGIWWGLQLLIALLNPSRGLAEIFWVSIPMLVLAAKAIERFISSEKGDSKVVVIAETAAVVALFVFSFMNCAALVNSSGLDAESLRDRIIGVLLPLFLLAVITALFAWGWSFKSTRRGFVIGLGVILFVAWSGTAWKAADLGSRPEFEIEFGGGTPVGQENLLTSIEDLSRWSTSQAYRIDIQMAGLSSNSLLWTLREFENLEVESNVSLNSSPSIILTTAGTEIQGSSDYRGQKLVWSVQPDVAQMTIKDWLNWTLFRTGPQERSEVILWVKNEVFLNQ